MPTKACEQPDGSHCITWTIRHFMLSTANDNYSAISLPQTSVSDCSRDAEFWQSETCLSPIKNPDAECTPKRNHGNWVGIHGIKAFNVSHPGTWEFQVRVKTLIIWKRVI